MAAPFPVEVQVQEVRRDVDIDEILAEAVRSFPVLYNKSLKEFKDNQMKDNAWKKVAEQVPGITSAADAKKRFKNLRARYTRDKNKVTKKKKSGGGTDEVQEAKKETSELYSYLGWLDSHVTRRRRSKGSLVPGEKSSQAEESDDYQSSLDESELESGRSELESSVETSTSEEKYSKATGNVKWEKRDKKSAKKDVDNVEVEMLKCMTQCLKKPPEKEKDEDELFGSFVASQLKGMSPEQNAMAKYQINQICFQIKMSNMGMPGSGYSSHQNIQGFPARQTFAPPLSPQMASQPFLQENQYTLLS